MAARAFGLAHWERVQRRRAVSLLILLAGTLVTKGLGALLFQVPVISDLLVAEFRSGGNWWYLIPAALLSGTPETNLILIGVGVITLGWVIKTLEPNQVSEETPPFAEPSARNDSIGTKTDSVASNREAVTKLSALGDVVRPVIQKAVAFWSDSGVETFDSDFPPQIPIWVGRKNEMQTVMNDGPSVFAITGIGGQGKSALAAKVLGEIKSTHPGIFSDWRDCREESDRFRTHLLSVLVRISNGKVTAANSRDLEFKWIVKRFFEFAHNVSGVIVFDNVDFYVNTDKASFSEPISEFVETALRVPHDLRIIFTCRPTVNYADIRFQNVSLAGLNEAESEELFRSILKTDATDEILKRVPRFCALSQGHPLWLTLIASQISKKPQSAEKLLRRLEAGDADEGPTAMLRAVWSNLGEDDKVIVRCLAEVNRAVERKQIAEYALEQCSSQKSFNKAFKRLQSIYLLTEKRGDHQHAPRYELHPMVRSFCRHEYAGVGEREDFISKLIVVCERSLIAIGVTDPVRRVEQVATKVELEFNNGDVSGAVKTLGGSADQMIELAAC